MDEKFTGWLVTEQKKTKLAPIDYLLLAGTLVAGIMLRAQVWEAPFENASYQNTILSMKIVTAVFEVLAAVMLGVIVHRLTDHKIQAFLAYGIGVVLPVLVAGSAMWGMGDSIYIFFVLLSLYLLMTGEGELVLSLIFYGMAVFFQLYALFLLPVYVWCFWRRKAASNSVLGFIAPIAGMALHLVMDNGAASAFALFREEGRLMSARGGVLLSYNYPNLYQLIGTDAYVHEYGTGFRYAVLGGIAVATVLGLRFIKEMTKEKIVALSLMLSMAIPWFLPFMDERAGLLAAVLSMLYGFANLNRFYIPVIQVTITYLSFAAYFRGESFLPMSVIALCQLGVLLYIVHMAVKEREGENEQ